MFYILYVNQTLSQLQLFYFPILLPVITVWINLSIIYITLLFSINFSTLISLHLTTKKIESVFPCIYRYKVRMKTKHCFYFITPSCKPIKNTLLNSTI